MQMVNLSVHFVTRDSIRRHKYSVTIIGAVQLDFENLLYLVSLNMLSCSINPDPVFSLLCPVPPPGQRSNVQSSSWTPVTSNNQQQEPSLYMQSSSSLSSCSTLQFWRLLNKSLHLMDTIIIQPTRTGEWIGVITEAGLVSVRWRIRIAKLLACCS